MTGRLAAILMLALLALLIAPAAASASSPKDAIKHLPKFSHSSSLRVIQNDSPGGRTYDESYTGAWTIDWRPPTVALSPNGKLKWAVYYSTTLQDQANRIDGRTNDLRRDYYRVNLNLDDVRWLGVSFALEHIDTFKSNSEWAAESPMNFNISWGMPDFPSVSYGYVNKATTRKANGQLTSASEFEQSQFRIDFKRNGGAFGQRYTYLNQDKRSRNFRPTGGTDEHITRFEGDRQFPLGTIGTLNFGYYYDQYSRSDSGTEDVSLTTTNQYRLSLGNNIPGMPVSYNYSYSDQQKEFPGGRHQAIASRAFKLEVTPPTPEGKSAAIGYTDELRDVNEPGRKSSNAKQELRWNFRPNKLTNANLTYSLETDYDLVAQDVTRKRSGFLGNLGYEIPGGRGSMSGNVTQWVESKPSGDARNTSDAVNLSSQLRLGNNANVSFNLAQQYSGSGSSLPGSSIDTTRSSVRYRISWPNNLSLDATYQQQLRVQNVDNKTVTENFGLKFDYRNESNWAYMFALNLGDNRDITDIDPAGRRYETQNVIEARVTYSF